MTRRDDPSAPAPVDRVRDRVGAAPIPAGVGPGTVGDILPEQPGLETWASNGAGLWSGGGEFLGTQIPGTNQSIRWAADMTTQVVTGARRRRRPLWTGGAGRC